MAASFADWVVERAKSRFSVLATVFAITITPNSYAASLTAGEAPGGLKAFKFFLSCVGIVLAVEAAFSFVFKTAFSDLVHNTFPALVALLSSLSIYIILKVLFTPGVTLPETMTHTLNVGGAGLLVMIITIFALLTIDFGLNYREVVDSPCKHRTIMCLASGGTLVEYDIPRASDSAIGSSTPWIFVVIFACLIHYSRVLGKVLKTAMGVTRARTYFAIFVSVVGLSPASLFFLNAIYRYLYAAA